MRMGLLQGKPPAEATGRAGHAALPRDPATQACARLTPAGKLAPEQPVISLVGCLMPETFGPAPILPQGGSFYCQCSPLTEPQVRKKTISCCWSLPSFPSPNPPPQPHVDAFQLPNPHPESTAPHCYPASFNDQDSCVLLVAQQVKHLPEKQETWV